MKIAASRPLKCGSGIIFFIVLVHSSSSCPIKKEKKKGKKHPISLFALLNTSSLTFTLGVHMIFCHFTKKVKKLEGDIHKFLPLHLTTYHHHYLPPSFLLSSHYRWIFHVPIQSQCHYEVHIFSPPKEHYLSNSPPSPSLILLLNHYYSYSYIVLFLPS